MNPQHEPLKIEVPLNEISSPNPIKNVKEGILKKVVAFICALLNTAGGTLELINDRQSKTGRENDPKQSEFIRMVEQQLISKIGSKLVTNNTSFDEQFQDKIVCKVKKSSSIITINYNLYLRSEKQVILVAPYEDIKDILRRKVIFEPVIADSHHKVFIMKKYCGFPENKVTELKCVSASSSKVKKQAADRIAGEDNRFSCYVSAFANNIGGHIYYGIEDDGIVKGQLLNNKEEKEDIIRKVEKAILKMIWPENVGKPKRGEQWEIFFEPVVDDFSIAIPLTFVIVIFIAPCPGGVFTKKPECYQMVEGGLQEMSFASWRNGILKEDVVPHLVPRILWSSDEIKQRCTRTSNDLMDLINNGEWGKLEKMAKLFESQVSGRQDCAALEVLLTIYSKRVIACSRQSYFTQARKFLNNFNKILKNVDDSPFFNALAAYLEIVIRRNKKDFGGIEEVMKDALTKAESIESGFLTAAIHVLVATVSSFNDQEPGLAIAQQRLCELAIEHLRAVEPTSVSRDMEQKAYITLVFSYLKCLLSKDLILDGRCTEEGMKKAKYALTALNELKMECPLSRFREIQAKLAEAVLYYRQSQHKEPTEARHFLKCSFTSARDAKDLAKKLKFGEMECWSDTLISKCTGELVLMRCPIIARN
ncbi:uncharacterized protein LOC114516993 [Dendronephthya gigantea]|uniref:uncharacterized protein LOC114516993 n=1 Tax=Dendronephthya gigantea TaxID=151771 RepID=UPI00106A8B86|nr:uncharacterized protein LOC114516993 [Dendronephthya gigantea]